MRLVTVAGGPSVGKTSIILRASELLHEKGLRVGVVKFDALSTRDDQLYREKGIDVTVGLSGSLCPDHYFVSNVQDCLEWGQRQDFDLLFTESAGLCSRCSPHIKEVLAICIVDALAGVHTPKKIGPMLRLADIVVITKGDVVSQVEREVFAYNVRLVCPGAQSLFCNGITGQGAARLADRLLHTEATTSLEGSRLRFPMPAAVCPYCVGETVIGETHQRGNVKKLQFADVEAK
jgi:Ni2+-binding GTPase involved in maturation of urease and hydrogenase